MITQTTVLHFVYLMRIAIGRELLSMKLRTVSKWLLI